MEDIVTPVNPDRFEQLLLEMNYDKEETEFIIQGFRYGFPLGYEGETNCRTMANNLKLTCGNTQDLWEKMMKEVKLGRFAGPFDKVPYDNFIQSPVGLVPKHEGQTRLIFHLSYPHGNLVNLNTPTEKCRVKYKDLDNAIRLCLQAGIGCFTAKSDMKSAFCNLPIRPEDRRWLVMKAKHPTSGKV